MSSGLLYMPLKIPQRHDLVQPLTHWLDKGTPNSSHGKAYSYSYATDNDNDDNTKEPPVPWKVPKPTFTSKDCRKELLRLAALRNCLSETLQNSHKAALADRGLEDCQEYHAILLAFEAQGFPAATNTEEEEEEEQQLYHDGTVDDQGHQADFHGENTQPPSHRLTLTWKGAFALGQLETHTSLVWDRACTLWNVAAFLSFEAAVNTDNLTTKEGCKAAISILQTAASSIVLLKELVLDPPIYSTVDFSNAMLTFWEKLLLGQAQFCVYKMANLGTARHHTTLAYLVQGAASLYNEALVAAQDPRLQSEVPKQSKTWGAHCKAQSLLCQSRAVFHLSIDHRIQKEHGLEVARLSQCLQHPLKDCYDFCKQAEMDMTQVNALLQLVKDRIERARHDNDTIYLEDTPAPQDLPEIRSQIMVKTTSQLPIQMMTPKVSLFDWNK